MQKACRLGVNMREAARRTGLIRNIISDIIITNAAQL